MARIMELCDIQALKARVLAHLSASHEVVMHSVCSF